MPQVLFVKVKERVLQNEWSFAVQAKKYTQWMEAQAGPGQTGWGTAAGKRCSGCACNLSLRCFATQHGPLPPGSAS